jgi:hypothetical protein
MRMKQRVVFKGSRILLNPQPCVLIGGVHSRMGDGVFHGLCSDAVVLRKISNGWRKGDSDGSIACPAADGLGVKPSGHAEQENQRPKEEKHPKRHAAPFVDLGGLGSVCGLSA